MTAEIIFVASITLMVYVYAGYPALIFLLSRLLGRPIRQAEMTPKLSMIITAYNEERDIAAKIENTLALDYPKEKLEIIVASDCSSDRTDETVRRYAGRGVILHRQPEHFGKTMAQKQAMKVSSGEILVMSDATSMYEPDALRKIVRSFADPEVGCVTGQLVYLDRALSAVGRGCRSYWGYEKFLKHCESQLGSLIGVSGCLYAVRRSNFARLSQDMIDDFVIATEIYLQGLRTVYDPEAVVTERTNKRSRDEFRMRVRVVEQTISVLHRYRKVLNPCRHGLFAFQLVSHKVLRYCVPLFLILAVASNAVLVTASERYVYTFTLQAALYLAALVGWVADRCGLGIGLLSLPYYFVLGNAAPLVAFLKFMRGDAHVVWTPIREASSPEGGPK